jgi:hypothetical protein
MFIFEVTVVLYFIKILGGSRNFYRLRMTWLTSTNAFTFSCWSIEPPPPPSTRSGNFSSTALVQSLAKSLLHYSSTIRNIRRLFADYSYYSSPIRGLFVLFVDYSRTICTIRGLFVLFVDYSLHYSSFINIERYSFTFHFTQFLSHFLNKLMLNRNYFFNSKSGEKVIPWLCFIGPSRNREKRLCNKAIKSHAKPFWKRACTRNTATLKQ